jgi:hypothetical protein
MIYILKGVYQKRDQGKPECKLELCNGLDQIRESESHEG